MASGAVGQRRAGGGGGGQAARGRTTPGLSADRNWALSGQATATTAQSGDPRERDRRRRGHRLVHLGLHGTLTVDLGQVRSLADLGLTLDTASPSA